MRHFSSSGSAWVISRCASCGVRRGFPYRAQHLDRGESGKRDLDQSGAGDGREGCAALLEGCSPGALPYILTGLRLGLARAWRVLVAVEMLTSVRLGLGWLIFGAREFLNTNVMLAGIAVIGLVGFLLEKLVFQKLERLTLVRWGMMEA